MRIQQVWECDKCGHRETTPVHAVEITCVNRHSHGRHTAVDLVWPLTLIWDRDGGTPMPTHDDAFAFSDGAAEGS